MDNLGNLHAEDFQLVIRIESVSGILLDCILKKMTILDEAFFLCHTIIVPSRNIRYKPGMMYNGWKWC